MLPLVITVEQTDGGTRRYAFADSPVSIGRSPFAELQLSEPFISRWEGTLRFDADEITYFSLGSTNATYVNGEPLAQREADVPLRVESVLTLGELKLRFSREPVPEPDLRRKGKPRPTLENTATGLKTEYLDAACWARSLAPRAANGPASTRTPAIAPQSCIVVGQEDLAQRRMTTSGPTLAELEPAAAQPAIAREPVARPCTSAAAGSKGVPRAPTLAGDSERQPELQCARLQPPGDIPELRDWMRAISPAIVPEGVPFDSQLALERVLGLLEVLIQSLAEIHDAQESVRRRWLGRSARRSILQSEDGNAVLAYLLDPHADWNDRSSELEQSVRDVVTHELALFRATLDGARTLVNSLAPDVIAASAAAGGEGADAEPAPGFWTRLLCKDAGEIGLWRRFLALYGELTDGARYERVFFGRVFSRSYLAAMGQGGPAPARS